MKGLITVGLLVASNIFMTIAWYGHLKFEDHKLFNKFGLAAIILVSWGIALFEYSLMIPANRIGFKENGGPFTLIQLKVMQEVITLVVFTVFTILVFKNETFKWNHFLGFVLLIMAVYFIMKK